MYLSRFNISSEVWTSFAKETHLSVLSIGGGKQPLISYCLEVVSGLQVAVSAFSFVPRVI